MTEQEVVDIIVGHLVDISTLEALVLSQKEIYTKILNNLTDSTFDKDHLSIAKQAVEIKAEFSRFANLAALADSKEEAITVELSPEFLAKILPMYKGFMDIFTFLYNNYDKIDFGIFAKELPKEELKQMLDILEMKFTVYSLQFQETGTISLFIKELRGISNGISVVLIILLGQELFLKFSDEVNRANIILRRIQGELSPSDPGSGNIM